MSIEDEVVADDRLAGRFGPRLTGCLNDFWDAWAGVAADPASLPARALVLAVAHATASSLNDVAGALAGSPIAHRATLDAIAAALVETVNAALVGGFDLVGDRGTELFRGTTAASLSVALDDPRALAASGVRGGGGDNRVANELSQAALRPGSADSILLALIGSVATTSAAEVARERTAAAVHSYADRLGTPAPEVDDATARDATARRLGTIAPVLAALRTHTDRPAGSSGRSIAAARRAATYLPGVLSRWSAGPSTTMPSDDPDAFVAALESRSSARRVRRYEAATDAALDWLWAADAAYTECLTALQQVRSVDTAEEVDALLRSMITRANAAYRGRPVFGGATAEPVAYDESGTYVGDAGSVLYTVAPRTAIDVAVSGADLFGDFFAELRKIAGLPVPSGILDLVDTVADRVRAAHRAGSEVRERLLRLAATREWSVARARGPEPLNEGDRTDLVGRVAAAEVAYRLSAETYSGVERESLREFLR